MNNAYKQFLGEALAELSVSSESNYKVEISDDLTVIAPFRILNFGGKNGMLIFEHYSQIREVADRLVNQGYGYTCLRVSKSGNKISKTSLIEMLSDWGWAGSVENCPTYLTQ